MNKSCLNWEAKATHLLQIRFLKFSNSQILDNKNINLVTD